MEQKSQKKIQRRLSLMEGQVRGLMQMVEDERDSKDLLTQLAAIRAALESVGSIVISNHIDEIAGSENIPADTRQEIGSLIKTFLK